MVSLQPPVCDFGWRPPGFSLKATDGRTYTLDDVKGPKGTLVMFICNHCPYVKAILDRLVRDARALQEKGIGVAAIMSNDPTDYPEDSFDNMARVAAANGFTFPYLLDETQQVGRAWDAVCTPDFFGFNADMELQYRGRLDASRKDPGPADARRDLFLAMCQVAETGQGPAEQIASMGCSIKWREE
ncbi:MAG: thioredoxin family protein [Hyphomicrobiales bacterium]|nr:thioredoxin family protein [Hyphomicrobiales bacterium]MCP5374002.1 thioredoxin family protein [Hyphomicrobiales bacterium]